MGYMDTLRRNNALFPKRVPIYTNRNSHNTFAKTEKILKFIAQQNQDICMSYICDVTILGSRLGRSQVKNDFKVQCRILLYIILGELLGGNVSCPTSIYGPGPHTDGGVTEVGWG